MRPQGTLLISIAALTAAPAFTQSEPIDPDPGNEQQVEDARTVLPRVGTDQVPIQPTKTPVSTPKQPGLTEGQDWLQILNDTLESQIGASTLAEGSFVLGRIGDLVKTPGGLMIFVPDRDQREPGEGAVLLMPCRTLELLQTEWSGQRVLISGEIFSYHNRNQLLISDYRLVREADEAQGTNDATEPVAEPQPDAATSQPLEDDPEVRDLMRELDRDRPAPPSNNDDPLAEEPSTLPRRPVSKPSVDTRGPEEGTLLLRRPARLVRNAKGAWAVVFDNDDPQSEDSYPLVVLPCKTLMRMENWAMQQGDSARFMVSGRVYSYMGEAYLLPTLSQRLGPSDINSIQ
ncbi:MAG: hypothetical protein ACF8MF_02440 [Phycisphaerales bacterium JB052]